MMLWHAGDGHWNALKATKNAKNNAWGRTPAHDGFECRLMRAENAEKTTGWLENGISAGSDDC